MGDRMLEQIPIFSSLSVSSRRQLIGKCGWRDFGAGEHIINQGDELDDVYIMASGWAQVVNYSESGKAVDYATLCEGDVFGELAAIDGLPRSAWVITKTSCKIASLPGKEFINVISSNAESSKILLQQLSTRIRASNERINDFSLLDAEQRVCLEILRMAEPDPESYGRLYVNQMPTQTNIGNSVGLARETVGRIMASLSQQEIIERRGRTLFIRNATSLNKLAMIR